MTINCVVARYKKNVEWVNNLKNLNGVFVYDKENPSNPYNVPINKGHEASVYLKYIIDNYDNLPDFTFFIHDEEYAWHHSGSIIHKYHEALEAINNGELFYNINDKNILGSIVSNQWYNEILEWYNKFIEPYIPMKNLPNKDWTVGFRGSAQFMVHKSLITNLSVDFYKGLYNWIITTNMPSSKSGRFMEWTWHLFWVIYPQLIKVF